VLNSVVLYAKPSEAKFVPSPDSEGDEERCPGTLYLDYGATFDVGDGQHRIGAYSDVMRDHSEDGDPIMERLRSAGQPVVIVIDDNPLHRAQDFTDLQRNAKPPSASIGLSMDRRQPVNRLLIELVQRPELQIFGTDAERVEFLKDSPGKLSAKLFSFKTVRYASGTLLIGISNRTTTSWDRAVNTHVEGDPAGTEAELFDFWDGLANLRPYAEVIEGSRPAAKVRDETYLTSAGVLYAIAYAVHVAREEHQIAVSEATKALDGQLTPSDTIFAGNLVDPESGRIAAGRGAWEAAGKAILEKIIEIAKPLT
jgi:DGQHR domain-containing protein